jgi:diacylglycerol kinase
LPGRTGLHPENRIAVQTAKDCAAGTVLLASAMVLVIAILTLAVSLGLAEIAAAA